MRKVDVAVIGAGQAGLATSFYLSQSGIDHVVLDRAGGQPHAAAIGDQVLSDLAAGILVCTSWGCS